MCLRYVAGWAPAAGSIASIKAWAGLVGMSGGPVRPPLVTHTDAEQAELAADLAAADLIPGG